nr:MAG TPA: hypothetical protein [Caudoviricetes sp.]
MEDFGFPCFRLPIAVGDTESLTLTERLVFL